jgi:hypothetical protein
MMISIYTTAALPHKTEGKGGEEKNTLLRCTRIGGVGELKPDSLMAKYIL